MAIIMYEGRKNIDLEKKIDAVNQNLQKVLCKECKYSRPINEAELVCGKHNLKLPAHQDEVRFGCWEKKEKEEKDRKEIVELKPNFYGIGIDLKNLFRWAIKHLKSFIKR